MKTNSFFCDFLCESAQKNLGKIMGDDFSITPFRKNQSYKK